MVISALELFAYFIAWSLFYFGISHYIAKLSKDKWVEWAKSTESDEDHLKTTKYNTEVTICNECQVILTKAVYTNWIPD